jgi:two-component system cell cycle response regulator
VVRDVSVEPRHAKICRESDGGYALRDLGIGEEIRVNDEDLGDERPLRSGDRIQVGSSLLEFITGDPVKEHFHREIYRLINRDHLTGLLAKPRFDEEFERCLEAVRERRTPLSVLMADVDDLKQINDAHGHLLGEFTVGEIGRIIGQCFEPDEAYGTRFGGDEYQVLLPGRAKEEAIRKADYLRRKIEGYSFERDGVYANPTLSVGVASYPEDGATRESLTRAADEALYRAKESGGNTVRE